MNREHSKLDFLVVAAARGGTTWLYFCLKDHSQVCLSSKKEFVPFEANGDVREIALDAQFADCDKPNALRGIMPVGISTRKDVSALVKKNFPNAKIIMCLRNPIERAYSQYKHYLAKGRLKGLTFSEVIRGAADVTSYGFYADVVESYRRDMGADKVLIILHDDMMRDHAGALIKVQEFLGIELRESEYVDKFISVSRGGRKSYHSEFLLNLYNDLKWLSAKAKRVGGPWVGRVFKRMKLGRLLEYLYHLNFNKGVDQGVEDNIEKVTILPEDRTFLKKYYADDMAKLSILLGRDLDWS